MLSPFKVAMQGVGSQPLLNAVQGLQPLAGPPPPPVISRGLVYNPQRSPLRSPMRDVVRW